MKEKLVIIGVTVFLIVVGLSGCTDQTNQDRNNGTSNGFSEDETEHEEEVDYTIPPEITSIIYDTEKFDVYNLIVETWGVNGSTEEKIGDGFLSMPKYYTSGYYFINGTVKNIAGYVIEQVDKKEMFYDENNESLLSSGWGPARVKLCESCTFSLYHKIYNSTTGSDRFHHMTIEIYIP